MGKVRKRDLPPVPCRYKKNRSGTFNILCGDPGKSCPAYFGFAHNTNILSPTLPPEWVHALRPDLSERTGGTLAVSHRPARRNSIAKEHLRTGENFLPIMQEAAAKDPAAIYAKHFAQRHETDKGEIRRARYNNKWLYLEADELPREALCPKCRLVVIITGDVPDK